MEFGAEAYRRAVEEVADELSTRADEICKMENFTTRPEGGGYRAPQGTGLRETRLAQS